MTTNLTSSIGETSEAIEAVTASAIACGFMRTNDEARSVGAYRYIVVLELAPHRKGPAVILASKLPASELFISEVDTSASRSDGFPIEARKAFDCFEQRLSARLPNVFRGDVR